MMKQLLTTINNENELYDLVKSRQTFRNIIIECPLCIFGPMYCRTERNSIVEVEGDVSYECIYPVLDREDALYLFNFYNFANEYSFYCEEQQLEFILSNCDICHKDDLSLKRILSYNGEAYIVNEIYIDNRTGKFYDAVLLEDDDYVYLGNSDEIF